MRVQVPHCTGYHARALRKDKAEPKPDQPSSYASRAAMPVKRSPAPATVPYDLNSSVLGRHPMRESQFYVDAHNRGVEPANPNNIAHATGSILRPHKFARAGCTLF